MGNDGLRIHFGLYQDGSEWSDLASSLGELRVGPLGMLAFLEGRLGLRGLETHQAIRINQYLRRVEACDFPQAWFHESFAADPWSTARQLLAWRDELMAVGWGGAPITSSSPRLQAISAIEQIDFPLAPGFADRLIQAGTHLSRLSPETIQLIVLEEPFNHQPKGWWKLFGNLMMKGTPVQEAEIGKVVCSADGEQPGNVLSFLKRALTPKLPEIPSMLVAEPVQSVENIPADISCNDETILLVEADTEWEAAESLALWLRSRPNANGDTTIILSRSSMILDQVMEKYGLPKLGGGEVSRWRAHLQILPLVCANAWKPAELGALVELLALPVGPVPPFARKLLLDALAKEPGVGGSAWKNVLLAIKERFLELGAGKGKGEDDADKFVETLEWMLVKDRYNPAEGIPEDSLKARCRWVIERIGPMVADDPSLAEALRQAEDLIRISEGKGRIPRVTLERMLDSVVGIGGVAGGAIREVAPWRVALHPGAVAYPSGTVIWWDFSADNTPAQTYWSATEYNDLLPLGVMLDEPGSARKRESFAWYNALAKTTKRMLLFRAKNILGEETECHPFWDAIAASIERTNLSVTADMFIRKPGDLVKDGVWRLADRHVDVGVATRTSLSLGSAIVDIPAGIVAAPGKTSYSDMKSLIECPMQWVLGKYAGIYASRLFSKPNESQCMGNICHAIARELFSDGERKWRPDEARKEAERLYDVFAEAMFMDLLAEGRKVDLARGRRDVGDTFHALARIMEKHGLTPEATEAEISRPLGDSELRGFIDLVCGDGKGGSFIIDFKWTGSAKRYQDEIVDGAAMQLAVYAWLLRENRPGADVGAGYYLLKQCRLLSDSSRLERDNLAAANSLGALFEMSVNSWRDELQRLAGGKIVARGVLEKQIRERDGVSEKEQFSALKAAAAENKRIYRQPSCRFCDFGVLCGIDSNAEMEGDQ